MMDKWKIAWEIYGALKLAGAEIGDASVPIIGEVLGEYITDEVPGRYDGNLREAEPLPMAACEALVEWESVASKAEEMEPSDPLYNVTVLQSGIKLTKAVRLATEAITAAKGETDGKRTRM